MSHFLDHQNWRYATKKFDATKKISERDLATLKEAIRLSASSYGLQPYKVFIIENPEIRAKLQPAAWGQSQIVEASHLFVFANQTNIGDQEIDSFLKTISIVRETPLDSLAGYGDFMKSKISPLDATLKANWTSKQTYIALANLLNAAAELKIDATPMEGFLPELVNEILGLDKLNLTASIIAPVGYRHMEDPTQFAKKVRKTSEELFVTI